MLANGVAQTRTFDRAGQLAGLATTGPGGPVGGVAYTRDGNGNPTSVDISGPGGLIATESMRLTYDRADRLLILGAERLDARSRKRLDVLLAFGDPDGQVFEAWQVKENVRDLYTLWVNPTLRCCGPTRSSTMPGLRLFRRSRVSAAP